MTFKDQTFRLLPDGTTQNEDTIMSRHISPYEIYAKHVLETMYPERYGTLLLRDKPDLQTEDGAAGIEVTSVNGEIFERLVSEIAVSQPYQAPSDRVLELCAKCGIEYHNWQTFVIKPLPAAGFVEPFRRKLQKLNAGYAFLGRYDLYLYSDRHTLEDYELEPLLETLCGENRAPISYKYVYIDADGKLVCFDLAHGTFEVRPISGMRLEPLEGLAD